MTINLTSTPRQLAALPGNQIRFVYLQLLNGTNAKVSSEPQAIIEGAGLSFSPSDGVMKFEWRGPMYVGGSGVLNYEII